MDSDAGLSELARTRRRALVGYAYLVCSDLREAEDLVQDALVAMVAKGNAHATISSLEAYARRTILNTYLDGFRRRKRWAAVRHLHAVPSEQPPSDLVTADHVPGRLDVQAALAQLAPRERACIILRFYEDMTVPQIAGELSLSAGTIKRYLSDAIGRLETLLGPLPSAHLEDLSVMSPGGRS